MLESGILDVRALLDSGYEKIGLGTDVAGGFTPSLLETMRHAILSSKMLKIERRLAGKEKEYRAIGFVEALYLATLGGARVLNLQDCVGTLDDGMDFDAIVVDLNGRSGHGKIDLFGGDSERDILEKFVYLGTEANISAVWVKGKPADK